MKETLTQQNVDDFFVSHFTKSSHNGGLVFKFTSRYSPTGHAITTASFNLSKNFESMPAKEFEVMCHTAIRNLKEISGEDLMNMYKANKPVWDVFEKNVKTEWTALSGIKSAYNNAGFKGNHLMGRLRMWADETGRHVNIKRVGLTKKIIVSKPIKELPWLK